MQSAEQVRYRLRLAEGFLEEARQDISSQRWSSCVDHSQLAEGMSHEAVLASPINPIELAGDDAHLRSVYWCFEPGGKDKDTRVEVARLT